MASPVDPITIPKLVGAALAAIGAVLVIRF